MTPEGWRRARLDDVARVIGGGTPSRESADYWGGSIPWATPTDITGLRGRFIQQTAWAITDAALRDSSAVVLPPGSLLVTSRATIGACAINRVPMATNQGFQSLVPADGASSEYLYYVIRHRQPELVRLAAGSTFLEISRRSLAAFNIDLPPFDEQRKIAAILAAVDESIEATQAVIDQLGVVKKAMMAELLTRGLPGRHTKFKTLGEWRLGRVEQGLTELPQSWELISLTDVARLESGHTPSRRNPEYWDGDIPWISLHDSKNLESAEMFETAQTVSSLGVDNSSARILPKGTVVFSRTATVGKCTIMGREMCTSQDFANYVCGERLHNRYLMQVLRHMQSEWERLMAGSTHQTIYMPVFRDLQILLPPLDEQVEIADRIAAVDTRIVSERVQLPALSTLKSALMSVLLTGEVRVKPDEAAP